MKMSKQRDLLSELEQKNKEYMQLFRYCYLNIKQAESYWIAFRDILIKKGITTHLEIDKIRQSYLGGDWLNEDNVKKELKRLSKIEGVKK